MIQSGRDLLIIFKHTQGEFKHAQGEFRNAQGDEGHRFRCNSFADALCGAAIARHLMRSRQSAGPGRGQRDGGQL